MAETIVRAARIIMSPTSESRFFVGRNARSATLRTIHTLPGEPTTAGLLTDRP
jgi:hypothetical protein